MDAKRKKEKRKNIIETKRKQRLAKDNVACGWLQFSIFQKKQTDIYIQYIHTNISVNL